MICAGHLCRRLGGSRQHGFPMSRKGGGDDVVSAALARAATRSKRMAELDGAGQAQLSEDVTAAGIR